ncbi:MAG: GNAT family N-acetyltransferase [Anaerolineales bacterium]|nr:MAG: GNAT family N-acetyltransferase [Anaerolineales bacterium]
MSNPQVRKLSPDQALTIPAALSSAATFTALDSWTGLVRDIYGYETHRFESSDNNEVTGILALTHVRHPIFGNYLATSPFGSFGGFAFSSSDARDALLDEARKLADELKVDYAVVRFVEENDSPPSAWIQNPIYSTYLIDLPSNPEDLMNTFGHQHRKHTRQSLRKGFKVQFGRHELLDETYEALARSMHELGSPYHSKEYLRKMASLLGENLEFVVIKDVEEDLVGSAVLVYHGDTATNLHANILHQYRSEYAGECLYWSILEHYIQKGMKVCDMGRSLNGSGNEIFKTKWKPRKVPLAYWYYLPKGGAIPELNQKSPKFQLAIWLWKRLPAFVVRALGPHLIRGIV